MPAEDNGRTLMVDMAPEEDKMLCLELVVASCLVAIACASVLNAADPKKTRVLVDLNGREGPANLDGLLGVCIYGPETDTSSAWHKAWKALGLKHVRNPKLDLSRETPRNGGADSENELDFAGLDGSMRIFREMSAENLFRFHGTPRHLSSKPDAEEENEDHYSQYAPKDYALWEQHVEAAVRHLVQEWGCAGVYYEVWNEPEDYKWYWKGLPGSTDTLGEYLNLYVHTAKAVKRADPTAKVGGPATAHWDSAAGGAHKWGLPQFLHAFAEYRDAHPAEPNLLDFIAWHDYFWISHCPSLLNGVAFVDKTLEDLGWKERPEYWVTEWNLAFGEWAEKHPPLKFAAHIAANIVEQANPRTSRLSRMYFYAFDYDGNPKAPLISGWVSPRYGKPGEKSGEILVQPSGAIFQMAKELNQGDLLRCEAGPPLRAAATGKGGQVRAMISNYNSEPFTAELAVEGIDKSAAEVQCRIQLVDERHSCDGTGLEQGEVTQLKASNGAVTVPMDMPGYSTALVTLDKAAD